MLLWGFVWDPLGLTRVASMSNASFQLLSILFSNPYIHALIDRYLSEWWWSVWHSKHVVITSVHLTAVPIHEGLPGYRSKEGHCCVCRHSNAWFLKIRPFCVSIFSLTICSCLYITPHHHASNINAWIPAHACGLQHTSLSCGVYGQVSIKKSHKHLSRNIRRHPQASPHICFSPLL